MLGDFIYFKRLVLLLTTILMGGLFSVKLLANISAPPSNYQYKKAFKVQRLSLSEGLSQSVVNDVVQDSDGYIWLGTEDGLNRFDGYEFKVYQHDHKKTNSLHENWVISLIEEPGFGLWVGTVSGLSFYDPETDSFIDYTKKNKNLRTHISSFIYSDNSIIWIGTDNGLFYFDRENKEVVPFKSAVGQIFDKAVESLTESADYIYAATSDCIFSIRKQTNQLVNLCKDKVLKPLFDVQQTVIKQKNDILWIGSLSGLYRYDIKQNILAHFVHDADNKYSISSNAIQDLVIDADSALWVATAAGLNKYTEDTEQFQRFTQGYFDDDGLSSNDIYSLYIDKQNLIWLGTYGSGVNILNPNQHQFEHILTKSDVFDLGKSNTVHAIEKDQYENLWIGSYGSGLIQLDLLTGEISRPFNQSASESDDYVYSLFIDYSNRLWVGTLSELRLFDLTTKKEIETHFFIDGVPIKTIRSVRRLHEDHQGRLWIGTSKGLFKVASIDIKKDKAVVNLTDITFSLPNSFSKISVTISAIIDDQNGDLWVGGDSGLLFYEVERERWLHFEYEEKNTLSLSNNNVQVIFEDGQGTIWVGTADGLNRINRGKTSEDIYFDRITTYEGLPSNSIYGLLEDESQRLWVSTTRGLVRYTHNTNNTDVYRKVDGLSSDEFNTGAFYSDGNGRLFFGSINGITIVNDIAQEVSAPVQKLLISNLKLGNRYADVYRLNHSQRPTVIQRSSESTIDLSVVNLDFDKMGTQRYRYRISGFDEQWNYLGTKRNIFIAGLPEGKYRMEIQSRSPSQEWNNQLLNLHLSVRKNFWSSTYAYYAFFVSIAVVFLALLIMLMRYYNRKIKRIENRRNIEALRLKESRADNHSLKLLLLDKENETTNLHNRIKSDQKKLDAEKYRDVATGFYRLNYLLEIRDDNSMNDIGMTDGQNALSFTNYSYYKTVVVFELNDYIRIHNVFGPLAATELAAKASINIRQNTNSETQVFCIQSGVFLILSSQENVEAFMDSMINLRHQILRSEYEIANGISANTKVSLSVMDISHAQVTIKTEMISVVNLMIQSHRFFVNRGEPAVIKISVNQKAMYFSQDNCIFDIVKMQKNGDLEFSRL